MVLCLLVSLSLIRVEFAVADSSDVIGQAGQFGYETGSRGAVANRRIADELYQQSLANEQKAWQGSTPNVGLLAKALQQSKDAKAADDQAKEFARAALHASNTGAHSGDFINQNYGMVSENKLKELSSTSSPYMGQVQNKLKGYGLQLSADKMQLQTPFGKFSVNADDSVLLKMAGGLASKLGYNPADVAKGQQDAIRERDAIAKRTIAAVDKELGARAKTKSEAGAAAASSEPPVAGAPQESEGAMVASENRKPAAVSRDSNPTQENGIKPMSEAEREVLERRKAMGHKIGVEGEQVFSPLGRRTQDLFLMIHTKYQSLNSDGVFYTN